MELTLRVESATVASLVSKDPVAVSADPIILPVAPVLRSVRIVDGAWTISLVVFVVALIDGSIRTGEVSPAAPLVVHPAASVLILGCPCVGAVAIEISILKASLVDVALTVIVYAISLAHVLLPPARVG